MAVFSTIKYDEKKFEFFLKAVDFMLLLCNNIIWRKLQHTLCKIIDRGAIFPQSSALRILTL